MIRLVYSDGFVKSSKRLPQQQRTKLARLLGILQNNPFHPQLQTKHLAGELAGLLSFRITRDWRVIFRFIDPATVQLVRTKHRREVYR